MGFSFVIMGRVCNKEKRVIHRDYESLLFMKDERIKISELCVNWYLDNAHYICCFYYIIFF